MTSEARICAIVPTYDNPETVRGVVEALGRAGLAVVLVDDGSHEAGRDACRRAAEADPTRVWLVRLGENRGKGAACVAGFRRARDLGFTHGFQVDADGQHDLDQVPAFLEAARRSPDALVLAYPVYDATAPRSRRIARKFTALWVALELGSRSKVKDALIGFRVYPLDRTLALARFGERMNFDVEVAVRLVRAGAPTVNLPVRVRYLAEAEGGISHFRPLRDNVAFARMHSRLCFEGSMLFLRRTLGWTSR